MFRFIIYEVHQKIVLSSLVKTTFVRGVAIQCNTSTEVQSVSDSRTSDIKSCNRQHRKQRVVTSGGPSFNKEYQRSHVLGVSGSDFPTETRSVGTAVPLSLREHATAHNNNMDLDQAQACKQRAIGIIIYSQETIQLIIITDQGGKS